MFKDVSQLKKHLAGVQKKLSEGTIMPYVDQAAAKYIIPSIGLEFYEELRDLALAAQEPAQEHQALAITLLQRSVAYYALLEALPFLVVQIGDLGVVEVDITNSTPIRQWNFYNLETVTATNGDTYLDQFLLHLERYADEFPTWMASDEFTLSRELLINSTGELNKHVPISNSRRAFLALRPYLVRATDLYILPLTGQDLLDKILDPPDGVKEYKTAAGHLAKALAQYAMLEALPELALQLNGAGFRLLADHDGIRERLNTKEEERRMRYTKALSLATQYLATAKHYLQQHVAQLPEFEQSPAYEAPQPGQLRPTKLKDNSNKPSFRV